MSLIQSVVNAFSQALSLVFTFVPKLIGFLILLLIGWLIATALKKAILLVLGKVGIDRLGERVGLSRLGEQIGMKIEISTLLAQIVYWFVFLIFLVPATDALGLSAVSGILNTLIAFIPNIFVAIIVLFIGVLAANFVATLILGVMGRAQMGTIFANIARYSILGFVAIIALEQLQIAPALLNILFTAVIGSVAVAFALAFGLGGQDTARRFLARGESSLISGAAQIEQQNTVAPVLADTPVE
ncbi:MAG: mechanosensitive ion channel [Ktedonobacteraceae bacterium]